VPWVLFGLEHGPAGDAVAVSMNFHIAAVVTLHIRSSLAVYARDSVCLGVVMLT